MQFKNLNYVVDIAKQFEFIAKSCRNSYLLQIEYLTQKIQAIS